MAQKTFSLSAKVGEYYKGDEKVVSYQKVGFMIQKDDGEGGVKTTIKLETLPIDKDRDGFITAFPNKKKENRNNDENSDGSQDGAPDDDLPF